MFKDINIISILHNNICAYPYNRRTSKQVLNSFILNYKTFDFFDSNFDHSSYLKICVKYHFFCRGLVYLSKFFKNNLNLTIFIQIF